MEENNNNIWDLEPDYFDGIDQRTESQACWCANCDELHDWVDQCGEETGL